MIEDSICHADEKFRSANSLPDPIYNSTLVTKFINTVMRDGKRSTAERILYESFDIIKERTGDDPLEGLQEGARQREAEPRGEVAPRRRLATTRCRSRSTRTAACRSASAGWSATRASRGDGKTMQEKLANELLDASNLRGGAVKKREDTHRMAEANKAFAHYRW